MRKEFIIGVILLACDELIFEMSATPTDWGK